jgi:hypothetical protein
MNWERHNTHLNQPDAIPCTGGLNLCRKQRPLHLLQEQVTAAAGVIRATNSNNHLPLKTTFAVPQSAALLLQLRIERNYSVTTATCIQAVMWQDAALHRCQKLAHSCCSMQNKQGKLDAAKPHSACRHVMHTASSTACSPAPLYQSRMSCP